MAATVKQKRLTWLDGVSLRSGSHNSIETGVCVMEAVAYVAGEPHSDHPACACPIITSFLISWNDSLPDDESRDRLLKDLVPNIVGTRSTKEIEQQRGFMAADWLIRTFTPTWLRLVPLVVHAETLERLPEITGVDQLLACTPVLVDIGKHSAAAMAAARDAAWAAVRAAARNAARDAVGDAVGNAARDAAWAAVRAAARNAARDAVGDAVGDAVWDAAWAAAWAAVGAAARDAVRDAVRDALKPTTERLQQSARELVERMIALSR